MWRKRKLMCTVGGDVNWCSFYGKPYGACSKRLKLKLPYNPTIPILNIFLQEKKKHTNSKTYTHLNVHCSLIYYCQEMEATERLISRWVDTEDVVQTHNGILLGHSKEGNVAIFNSTEGCRPIILSEISQTETSITWFHAHVESTRQSKTITDP